ncbi:choline BCCT transporter BetT [Nocardioides sp. WL0053]|uniref:Choline BCCT transporter BetT n=1 Tax=Nocardioides jiangsuensis TaxID=2866161 RepID=A0ABS7RND6_9ACTN|nr:choline BCCT transporter BetT [Nocardioides jiangsuensis]MBY9076047.1 choline BCCT transporter BetT [Nocardioides jiangsuensis]
MSETTLHDKEAELEPPAKIRPVVFLTSAAVTLAIAIWAIIAPTAAADTIGVLVGWTTSWFGWFYILLATVVLVFVVFLGVSRYGRTKLGPEHSQPEFSTFSWAAMLFAAGIGTDLMFFSVAEPVTQYLAPPVGQGETVQAAREASTWTLFHYGISGWGMYALMGMALAYFSYRMNLPLAIRSSLFPIFGKRIHGVLGHSVDSAAVIGTIFGVATSLGIGVVQLNYGLEMLMGIPEGVPAQIGLVVLAVLIATISAVSGVDKGIKRLSQLNVLLAIGLAVWILVTGKTTFLLNAFVLNIGDYVSSFAGLTNQTFAYDQPVQWMSWWTLFFWAWWIAWASFVGLFLARISRGRTIRQFVAGTLIIPFSYVLMWVSIFGNAAIDAVRSGDAAFGRLAMNTPERGFYTLLTQYPAFTFIAAVATFVGLLFYVTSADSAALVMANLSSKLRTPQDDATKGARIFWAVATGLLTMSMLLVGGVPALQNATIIMGLPFAFVIVLVMAGLYKALRVEAYRAESVRQSMPGVLSGRTTPSPESHQGRPWRARLSRAMAFPGALKVAEFVDDVALPALEDVAEELRRQGVEATVDKVADNGTSYVELAADLGTEHPFHYRMWPREVPLPIYGRGPAGHDVYSRLEVHLREGGQGYDVMGYTHTQLIDDVLDQYERHLEFLRLNAGSPA